MSELLLFFNTKKVKIKQSEQQNYPLMYNEEFMEFTQANIDFEYDINSNTKRYNLEFKTDEDTSNNIFVIQSMGMSWICSVPQFITNKY